jgi:hypothetical protein
MSEASPALDRLVALACRDPLFLGCAMADYQLTHDLDASGLAAWLGCSLGALSRLSLCRMPDDHSGRFTDDILKIARFASCNPDRLLQLLREVLVLRGLGRGVPESRAGLLAAARDRKREGGGGPPPPERRRNK